MRIVALVVAGAIACLWRVSREPAPAPVPVRTASRRADLTPLARPVAQRSAAIVLPDVEREPVAISADDEPPLGDESLEADEPLDDEKLAREAAELAAWNRAPAPDSIDLSERAEYAEVIEIEGYAVPIDTTSVSN